MKLQNTKDTVKPLSTAQARHKKNALILPRTVQDPDHSLEILQSLHDLLSIVQDRPPKKNDSNI